MSTAQATPSPPPARRVDPRYFLIFLGPVIILMIHNFISDHLMPADLEVSADILRDGQNWLEAAGRYRFLSATWLFGTLSVLAAAMLCRTLMQPTTRETRAAAIATFSVILLLAVWPTLRDLGSPGNGQTYDPLGSAVFEGVMARGTLRACTSPEASWLMGTCGDAPVVTMFSRVVDLVNLFAGLALGSIIVGMILSLDNRACETVEDEAALLAENLRYMRQQLYLSGLVLSFGMLYAASWIYWPLPLVAEADRDAYGAVLLSASLYTGTYFSLLMLSFYLPVTLVLDGRVKSLAERAGHQDLIGEPPDVQGWRAARGLKEGTADYLRAGFALTSPILAAFAGGIAPLSF